MKIKFKCRECGRLNEVETVPVLLREAAEIGPREAAEDGPGEAAEVSPGRTYLLKCKWCGAKHSIPIREEEE